MGFTPAREEHGRKRFRMVRIVSECSLQLFLVSFLTESSLSAFAFHVCRSEVGEDNPANLTHSPKSKVPKVPKVSKECPVQDSSNEELRVPLLQTCLKSIGFHQCKDFRFNAGDCLFDSISYLLREKCIKDISSCALQQECIKKLRHDV